MRGANEFVDIILTQRKCVAIVLLRIPEYWQSISRLIPAIVFDVDEPFVYEAKNTSIYFDNIRWRLFLSQLISLRFVSGCPQPGDPIEL